MLASGCKVSWRRDCGSAKTKVVAEARKQWRKVDSWQNLASVGNKQKVDIEYFDKLLCLHLFVLLLVLM